MSLDEELHDAARDLCDALASESAAVATLSGKFFCCALESRQGVAVMSTAYPSGVDVERACAGLCARVFAVCDSAHMHVADASACMYMCTYM